MTPVTTPVTSSIDVQKFQGGKGLLTKAGGIGVLGLVGALAGMAIAPKAAFPAYLIAFAYWAGIGIAALILLMTMHTFRAKWPVVVRRPLETMAVSIMPFILLFVPVALGMSHIYSWVHPNHDVLNHEQLELLHHKASYLNTGFFLVRSFGYLVIAFLVAQRLFGLSTRQDETGDPQLTASARRLSPGLLPFVGLVLTFAGFDWLMSVNPLWFSTIFGAYYFAGSVMSVVAILIIFASWGRGKDNFGSFVSPDHLQNLGKLLFAFTCFWAYIATSQLLLIWIAGLPEETGFYIVRKHGVWGVLSAVMILGHFFVPFGILLSRNIKRNPRRLPLMALYALVIHFVDIYWLVMPTFSPDGLGFSVWHLLAWVGVGGIGVAFAVWKIRGRFTVPVKDPYLAVSLRYRQPI